MIFFTNNNTKFTGLFVLVLVFSLVMIVGWVKTNSLQSTQNSLADGEWANITEQSFEAWEKAQESFEFSKTQTKNLGEELQREVEQQALLEETREYLDNVTSTPSE
ncbi:MAG: hypothetical protein COV55_02445 [Candidatus Komeilibacteria bacterium CG11_big_fil_rev_8_21_14_0_20_36_20]|uniref:Uncharacterized protein n=1 Tax=Candidatus Komeilibacteria bacterium CG11_big_fil_rev_8_21_14_0_20_36_20 TaxID=1974477 RepID=A0A2H0ND43_9BACT|nr:MAG: hypothetical protein COV55_02445 [Candidatus Komeilibacteria bacterium CG11_big_fil_rev_8_21_14_0_20_36_20]PIR81833.1 MAG: hypothetical protein COU21_01505 [Candidatus Komeilibacteria bacterium CG10_big_fil_rev_8_21_14_0_10_36_65]PJC55323.1 MAG: hypothetical protein CO027_02840 [Candidatus Komeilibacteria bacterium CG_4_9_14_0_2_um_filter_36_13]